MLDKIQGNQADSISQSELLDRIKEVDAKNHYINNDSDFFVDESDISAEAYKKYEREVDVKRFSQILLQTDENEANDLVLQKTFEGSIRIDETGILDDLINSSELLNEIL